MKIAGSNIITQRLDHRSANVVGYHAEGKCLHRGRKINNTMTIQAFWQVITAKKKRKLYSLKVLEKNPNRNFKGTQREEDGKDVYGPSH
jgi:hypothetical protein